MLINEITEKKLTKAERGEQERLKQKFDKKGLKKDFIKRFGKEGENVYFGTITNMVKRRA